ncbi:[FeFe] hydrogenase H-cluster radical SAM maturase HydG [Oleidesulfovibrio sp.]|uniref:[FeFe] hydrogenase H-cluster radical SAM maturase HydG n=1 Tax=Oleidesulfovibrio sp. TaxID=2909707 RepID=UPI003A844A82
MPTIKDMVRRTLTDDELRNEVLALEKQGQKRLLLVYGEHPRFGADWIARTMSIVYDTVCGSAEIRRVNVNCAPLDVDGFRKLKEAGIGTYQCFQETYHRPTYRAVHKGGRKADYLWRLHALHRAQEAGIDDVACGVLFGLYDHRFEVLGLLAHAERLEKDFGVGPHTVSFPRLEPAAGMPLAAQPPHPVDDTTFRRIIAVVRLALPYTGLILSTRESATLRDELIAHGITQISAASRTTPGGYAEETDNCCDDAETGQFSLGDHRPLETVVRDVVLGHGFVPSWCTACYRKGRTGYHFMGLARTGFIRNFCHPNALWSFQEYLIDFASAETRAEGEALIER